MNTYTGITIGPIFQTIDRARKTREMWSSSFLFSYLSEQLTAAFNSDENKKHLQVLLPYWKPRTEFLGAGLYPDRIIIQHLDSEAATCIRNTVREVFKKLSKDIHNRLAQYDELGLTNVDTTEMDVPSEEFLKTFFKLYAQTIDVKAGENILFTLSPYLDSIEEVPRLHDLTKYESSIGHFLLNASLQNVDRGGKKSFLVEHAFGGNHKYFPSLIEIATRDLQSTNPNLFDKILRDHFKKINIGMPTDEEDQIFDDLFSAFGKDHFLHHHRHVAIVHADGDNISQTLKEIGDSPKDIQTFSAFLHNYAEEAAKVITDYGALSVYAGGDDLFFIAPVSRKTNGDLPATILHLAQKLDNLFTDFYKKLTIDLPRLEELKLKPKLSFGINIEHVKSPLYEGIRQSRRLLVEVAKNTARFPNKHVIALRQATHSGNDQEVCFQMDQAHLFESCLQFIDLYKKEDTHFLSALSRRLFLLHPLFEAAIIENQISIYKFLHEMVKHETKEASTLDFDHRLADLLHSIYDHNNKFDDQQTYNLEQNPRQQILEFVLRFVHFLNRKIDF